MQEQKGSSSPSISTLSIVQMNDVSASYDSKNYVLKNIKMSITRGTNYAIVGQSGSGKSTLLKLINGMMNPSQGKIMVDYRIPNISDKKFKSFMHKIGYIPFPGTLNIKLNQLQATQIIQQLDELESVIIEPFSDGKRTYGWVKCFHATLNNSIKCELIRLERTHHNNSIIELISKNNLRKTSKLKTGSKVTIQIHG